MTEIIVQRPCVRGCVKPDGNPYPATHGNYCGRCYGRIDMALSIAGDLTLHLLANALTSQGGTDERIQASKDAPVPFNQAAFDDANELHSLLTYWIEVWAGHLDQRVRVSGWRRESGTIVGLPAGITAEAGAQLVTVGATWVRGRLDEILATDHTDDIDALDHAIRDVWRMNARWPRVEKPSYSQVPCPHDECKRKIAVYPPALPGDDRLIVCQGGHTFPEAEYEHLILVFKETAKAEKQVARTVAHLAKKYRIGV